LSEQQRAAPDNRGYAGSGKREAGSGKRENIHRNYVMDPTRKYVRDRSVDRMIEKIVVGIGKL
jgi:hypothetical protein